MRVPFSFLKRSCCPPVKRGAKPFLAAVILTLVLLWGGAVNAAKHTVWRCGQWLEVAARAGWEPRHFEKLDYLLWRESRCRPQVINKTLNADGSWDYGLLQINGRSWCQKTRWYPEGYLQSLSVLDYCIELLDPYTNLLAAKTLYDYSEKTNKNGFQPWGV